VRLMPFRAPNVEPLMASIMPIGKTSGPLFSFIFGFFSILAYDSITSGVGVWTIITGFCYGFIGLISFYYFRNRVSNWKNYGLYAIIMTLLYDALTGLTIGPLFFHQSFLVSLVGQIPFTILHLLGNVSFAIILSPVIERWIIKDSKFCVLSEKLEMQKM